MIVCPECGISKPEANFTMYERDQESTCNSCCRIIMCTALRAKDRPLKRCRRCGDDKPLDEFYAKADTKDGRHHECKQCLKAHSNARRLKTAVRATSKRRECNETPLSARLCVSGNAGAQARLLGDDCPQICGQRSLTQAIKDRRACSLALD